MAQSGQRFWFAVRSAAKSIPGHKYQALFLWLEPEEHGLRTNEVGFPVGVPLRALSRRMAQLGLCNGKGKEYHPYQLQEMIFEGFPFAAAVVLNVELTSETRQALKETFIEGYRQKTVFSRLTPEEQCRLSWRVNRLLRKPRKRVDPWDQSRDEDEPGAAGCLEIGRASCRERV